MTLCRYFAVLLIFLSLAGPVNAQRAFDINEKYAFVELYNRHESDSMIHQYAAGLGAGFPLNENGLVYEWKRSMLSGVNFVGRNDKDRFAATMLVASSAMAVTVWTMLAFGVDTSTINKVPYYALAPFGSHLGYRPTRWITLYGGVIPEIMLFTEHDGLLAQMRGGFRLDVGLGLCLDFGYAKTMFWGFESPSRVFPGDIFWGISYVSPIGSFLLY